MIRLARAYLALLRAGLAETLEYRAQSLLWLLLALVPLIMLTAWLAIVDEAGPAAGWRRADFISYYVAVAVVFQLTTSFTAWEWQEEIRNGDLSIRLLKPLDPFHYYISRQISRKLFSAMLVVPIIVVAGLIVPEINFPLDPVRFVAFVVAMLAGFLLTHLMGTAFGMISFWSTRSANLYDLWYGIGQFLSGWLAPLALFPAWFGQTAALLPFRSTLGFPVEILTGRLEWTGIGAGFAISAGWIAVFWAVYRLLWRRGVARYEAVGS